MLSRLPDKILIRLSSIIWHNLFLGHHRMIANWFGCHLTRGIEPSWTLRSMSPIIRRAFSSLGNWCRQTMVDDVTL